MPSPEEKNAIRLAGVMGWPISHSLSPLIHATWAAREGRASYYTPLAVAPGRESLSKALASAANLGFSGVNITLPHKEDALALSDEASAAARAIGAANMITFTKNGLCADNSDAPGFADALKAVLYADETPARALVLGAGGAARGVVFALKTLVGVNAVVIANRTREKAEDIARAQNAEAIDWDQRNEALDSYDVIVNATSLGMTGSRPLEIGDGWRRDAIVADIVYSPLETPLLKRASETGVRMVDGLAMLMGQAAAGYRAWLGDEARVDADLRARLVAALEVRG